MGARPSTFADAVKPEPARVWSAQHEEIFNWFRYEPLSRKHDTPDRPPMNLVVTARAGATKTSTIIEGVNRAPESDILVCAFSKLIADELSSRVTNPNVTVKTLHSLGYQMIRRAWRGMPVCDRDSKVQRADTLTDKMLAPFEKTIHEKVPFAIRRMITQLHSKGREMVPLDVDYAKLEELAYRFDLAPDNGWSWQHKDANGLIVNHGQYDIEFVVIYALMVMHEAATVEPDYEVGIDYPDMIYLPLAWRLTARDYQLVVVDEAQDLTIAQLEIAERVCNGRICIVGDDRQAIFGFRGSDSGSLARLKVKLAAVELPLTVSYRCPASVVGEAKRLVPDIEARPETGEGVVDECSPGALLTLAKPHDFILSRTNAPLVSLVLQFARKGIRARMVGRDIGREIVNILKKLKCLPATPIDVTIEKIEDWRRKQATKLAASGHGNLVWRIHDQADMLIALAEDNDSTQDLIRSIETLFTDDTEGGQIVCSSVHKAKGLEANRVFILYDTLYRFGRTAEEVNIEYVAITRAKQHLTYVRS